MLTAPATASAPNTSHAGHAQQPRDDLLVEVVAVAVARERGVEVDGVRHDGGTEHAGGEQDGRRAVEARHEAAGGGTPVDRAHEEPGEEADRDHGEQPDDDGLERALPASGLHGEDADRDDADDEPAERQRNAEQQVECDGAADDLGQVGGGGDQFGLHPERAAWPGRQPLAEQFGQAGAGDDAELRRLVLHEDGDRVGGDEHPDEQVAVFGAGGQVRCDVAGVDVGDGRDERRAEQQQRAGARPTTTGRTTPGATRDVD